ncbi:hypothetical protein [Flagellimonas meridianipacifica]|uniref:Uncharacterized protein n=1 Tax=Flagellimonas meridianipacifica TaxID=1080225 RepID=A0A2T0MBG0_9FLAO|nr:hypothetical protein [Allomuricauda pacifica]PRX54752.1 hypothetical protein CLV81_3156 [Allomuricauda pacifica]
MEKVTRKKRYLEQKREAILGLGYEYIKFRSNARKSLTRLKHIIKNNTHHFEEVCDL